MKFIQWQSIKDFISLFGQWQTIYPGRGSWTRSTYRDNVRCAQVDRAAAISGALIYEGLFIWILVEPVLSSLYNAALSGRGTRSWSLDKWSEGTRGTELAPFEYSTRLDRLMIPDSSLFLRLIQGNRRFESFTTSLTI